MVRGVRKSAWAIWLLVRPSAAMRATRCSLGVRDEARCGSRCGAAGGGGERVKLSCDLGGGAGFSCSWRRSPVKS